MKAEDHTPGWATGLALAVVVLFAAPTLLYPYGRDQALYHYVATGWLDGFWPYRDSFDHKPPALYLIYAAGAAISGREMWGIRLLDIVAVLGTSFGLAQALRHLGSRANAGVIALLTAGFYWTALDYWHTAQAELWLALFLAWSWALVEGKPSPARASIAGGLAGLAFMVKFPVAVVGAALAARIAMQLRGDRALGPTLGAFVGGGALVTAALLLPLAAGGVLADAWDVLIGFNAHHARNSENLLGFSTELLLFGRVYLLVLVPLIGVALARVDAAERRIGAISVAMLAATLLAVLVQRKFFPYHWGLVIPFLSATGAWALAALPQTRGLRALGIAGAIGALGLLGAPRWHHNPTWNTGQQWLATAKLLQGRMDRARFDAVFLSGHPPRFRYDFKAVQAVSARITADAEPGDALCCRGYEPTAYVLTGLRCPSRFAADFPLRDKKLAYRREAWKAEHQRVLEASPPRFVVLPKPMANDRAELFGSGYRLVEEHGRYQLFER